jgi:hypothetical protein
MKNEEQALMLLKTAFSLIRKLGVEISFIPSGRKRAVKLPLVVEQFLCKLCPAGRRPKNPWNGGRSSAGTKV